MLLPPPRSCLPKRGDGDETNHVVYNLVPFPLAMIHSDKESLKATSNTRQTISIIAERSLPKSFLSLLIILFSFQLPLGMAGS